MLTQLVLMRHPPHPHPHCRPNLGWGGVAAKPDGWFSPCDPFCWFFQVRGCQCCSAGGTLSLPSLCSSTWSAFKCNSRFAGILPRCLFSPSRTQPLSQSCSFGTRLCEEVRGSSFSAGWLVRRSHMHQTHSEGLPLQPGQWPTGPANVLFYLTWKLVEVKQETCFCFFNK